jgi:hypothetical protein
MRVRECGQERVITGYETAGQLDGTSLTPIFYNRDLFCLASAWAADVEIAFPTGATVEMAFYAVHVGVAFVDF